ncbi:hypothetical protein MNBD_GAMMA07-2241 [hydrothermal vent metagenome]|uniref:Type II secretion system protein GspB C-terminal domain-containing protein n=1 Tax=hydrothermal vent metagenome TaxID=652676 RepID=A0A3B0WUZ2_9ZZZZ
MSYILDALKKSEQERKQGGVPNLQTVHIPVGVESQTPWVLYAFITVLLLVLAFVIGLVISNKTPSGVSEEDTEATKQSLERSSVAVAQQPDVKVVTPREDVYQNLNTVNVGVQAEPKPLDTPVKRILKKDNTIASKRKRPDLSDIPYLHEMQDYLQQSVPEMTFAGHVYSSTPSSRSVIINNVAMSEGDTVIQGINVVEITTSGVIFSLNDEFFRMDILQDWSF